MQAPDTGKFFKGLAVVNNVAYFGISVSLQRQHRTDEEFDSERAAFDLNAGKLLWRRTVGFLSGNGGWILDRKC